MMIANSDQMNREYSGILRHVANYDPRLRAQAGEMFAIFKVPEWRCAS